MPARLEFEHDGKTADLVMIRVRRVYVYTLGFGIGLMAAAAPGATLFLDSGPTLLQPVELGAWSAAGDAEGWTGMNVQGLAVSNGFIHAQTTGSNPDPQLALSLSNSTLSNVPPTLGIGSLPTQVDLVEIRMRLPSSTATSGSLPVSDWFFLPDAGGTLVRIGTADGSTGVTLPFDDQFHTYTIQFDSGDSAWGGAHTGVRFDPVGGVVVGTQTLAFAIDSVRVGRSVPVMINSNLPHVVFCIVDDMGYSDVGCYGGEIETPNIDRLADEGIRFRQFYNCAKCETSRTTLLSGLYHGRAGIGIVNGKTVGEVLQSAGYRTAVAGKWHMNGNPIDRGFNRFYGIESGSSDHFFPFKQNLMFLDKTQLTMADRPPDFYTTDSYTDFALEFMADTVSNYPGVPFYLYLAYTAPHSPIQVPQADALKYLDRYESNGWDVVVQERYQRQVQMGIVDPAWVLPERPEDVPAWTQLPLEIQDLEDARMAAYAGMVDRIDQNFGRVLQHLQDLGIEDNTIVFFCSDNGSSPYDRTPAGQRDRSVQPWDTNSQWRVGAALAWLNNTPYRYYKQNQMNGGILCPMIVRWPDVISQTGTITDTIGHFVDITSTLVDITEADYDALGAPALDGISLLPEFQGQSITSRPPLWFEFQGEDFALIDADWKIASYRRGPWRLYNLATDRAETRNLARAFPDVLDSMVSNYNALAGTMNGPGFPRLFTGTEPATSSYRYWERYLNPTNGVLYSRLPVGYTGTLVGTATSADVLDANGGWTVTCEGERIGQTNDSFYFIHDSFFGAGEVVLKLDSWTGSLGSSARVGAMLRDGLDPGARFVMAEINLNGGAPQARFRYRATPGANTVLVSSPDTFSLPAWVRLAREGNTFRAYWSTNVLDWTEFYSGPHDLSLEVYAGAAFCPQQAIGASGTFEIHDLEFFDSGTYPLGDLDGDGASAFLEFAMGTSDLSSTDQPAARFRLVRSPSNNAELVYTRLANAGTGLGYGIDRTGDLETWDDDTGSWNFIPPPQAETNGYEQVRFQKEYEGTNAFYRLHIARP